MKVKILMNERVINSPEEVVTFQNAVLSAYLINRESFVLRWVRVGVTYDIRVCLVATHHRPGRFQFIGIVTNDHCDLAKGQYIRVNFPTVNLLNRGQNLWEFDLDVFGRESEVPLPPFFFEEKRVTLKSSLPLIAVTSSSVT